MSARGVIETVAILLAAGLASELVAGLLRVPRMVVLVGAGALLGPDALGVVDVPLDAIGVEVLLTLGVSFILFHGGLGLSLRVLRPVAAGLALLAVPGVVLTALVTGTVAAAAFGLPYEAGLLVGAVLAPTDPAILIPLFERMRLRPKVVQTLVAESALNDPTGAVLALAVAAFVLGDGESLVSPLEEFAIDLGISTAIGLLFGGALVLAVSNARVGVWRESPALAVLLVVSAGYFTIDSAGGNGYFGAFLAGLLLGNARTLGLEMAAGREEEVRALARTAADVTVLLVFVVLGANLPFGDIADKALPALATVAVLVLVARPLAVVACLTPNRRGRWSPGEVAFVAWTRETGVVPAALVGVLVAEGVPYEAELVTAVATAIVVTLAVQSTTKAWLARRLGLDDG